MIAVQVNKWFSYFTFYLNKPYNFSVITNNVYYILNNNYSVFTGGLKK